MEAGENDIQVVEQLDKESCRVVRVTVYDCRKNQAKDDNNEEMDLTMKQ